MLNLGVRRSDLVKLGWRNLVNERIEFSPQKGAAHDMKWLSLPVTEELREALEATTHEEPTFLITEYRKAFTSNGFGNKMRQWCNDAHLPECSSHGLRKASATILAEAGATEHQLMAIFGWSDSKMAQHYTKAAQSKRIIDAGFERRKTYVDRKNVPLSSNRNSGETNRGKNHGKTTSEDRNGGPGGTRTPNQAVMSRRL
jgi:integrase